MSTTICVSEKTRNTLHQLSRDVGVPIVDIVERAIEHYRRQHILDQANAVYAALRADPTAWAEMQAERAVWDVTVADGLEDH
ncbi:MAG: toxin-antitoxin system protein [Roseiflexaceae bacterium]